MADAEMVRRETSFWRHAVVTVPAILLLGLASGWVSNSGYGNPWFDGLAKPQAMPPGWTFGAVWTTLYILLGVALAFILQAPNSGTRRTALILFGSQMMLNFLWSPVFFGMHQPRLALAIIVVMLVLSIATTFWVARIRKAAAWLMVPYMVWLSFASILNYEIIRLNPAS
ncbi:tryptophan-rich sensory protein [Allosphingosinicella flava]|uniref:Tryptophan-rich sensory protein n=1 Tax=Allosphingosinicella flava TaxID=2771430 RepID=A0A7T2LM37_9SPHN|nr:TspO/MBR family protein [Sphingosinicella flava]QPQ55119.1 tryptophan-rich sensory protein [Sphingosinicella flava]